MAEAPLIWVLTGRNAGDNAQAQALAAAVAKEIGGQVRDVQLRFNLLREVPGLGPTCATLREVPDLHPAPDLVIGVGRRAVPFGRWLKARFAARLVWIGRPRVDPAHFDLLLTTPQYGVPARPHVIALSLPFGEAGTPARPRTPLMVIGGDSWSCRLTDDTVEHLAEAAGILQAGEGVGRLRITTSPRTPAPFSAAVAARLPDAEFHHFGSGANPYRGWLAEADACIVTGDSISLIADAVATGAPTHVVSPARARWLGALASLAPALTSRWLAQAGNWPVLAPPPYPEAVTDALVTTGCAERRPYGVVIPDLRERITAERRAALSRAVALLD